MSESVGNFDAVLAEIGQLGRWQKKLIVFLWLPSVFCGAGIMVYSFAMGTPQDYRCFVPECDNPDKGAVVVREEWISQIAPPFKGDGFSKCEMLQSPYRECGDNRSVRIKWDEAPLQNCDDWVYDTSDYDRSVVMEYDLVCDKNHWKSLLGMLNAVAVGVGASIIGFMSDKFGRKIVCLICLICNILFFVCATFTSTYSAFCVFFVISQMFIYGTYLPPYVLTVEIVGSDYAALTSILMNFPFVLGELIFVAVAYFFKDYKSMIRVALLPMLAILLIGFFIPESPRWLFAAGKKEEAKKVIKKGAEINGVALSDKRLEELIASRIDSKETVKQLNLTDLFFIPFLLKRLLIMYVNFIVVVMCYHGMIFNSVNLKGSAHLNMALGIVIEIPSYLFCIFTIDNFGRKPVLILTHFICAFCSLAALPVIYFKGPAWIVTAMATVAKFGTTAAFTIVLLQVIEMFPTNVRNSAMGSCTLFARTGAILVPVIANLGPGFEDVPFIIFGVSSLLAAFVSFLLPETRGKELPATVEEARENDDAPTLRQIIACRRCSK